MKTAEEWLHSNTTKIADQKHYVTGLWGYVTVCESDHSEEGLLDFVKQIQLDAWKQGCADMATASTMKMNMPPLPQELREELASKK